jgi:prepilin-type N-terminal cleavage/methylation domain-containing protein
MADDAVTRRPQGGFTMIEVMIAITVTAIATSGLLALFMVETRASGFSRHSTEATVLAEDQLERLRTAAAPTVTTSGSQTGIDERGKSGGIFNRTWTTTVGSTYYDTSVTVTWPEDGTTRTVTLRSRRNQ